MTKQELNDKWRDLICACDTGDTIVEHDLTDYSTHGLFELIHLIYEAYKFHDNNFEVALGDIQCKS